MLHRSQQSDALPTNPAPMLYVVDNLGKSMGLRGGNTVFVRNAALRTPGQIPGKSAARGDMVSRDAVAAHRMANAKPETNQQAVLARQEAPRLTARSVVENLGLSAEEEADWKFFISGLNRSDFEALDARSAFVERARTSQLEPVIRMAMYRRFMQYLRDKGLSKACTYQVHDPSALAKADARGGKYHARVPKAGGGYRYIYDGAEYAKREDAHLHGPQVSKRNAHKATQEAVHSSGKRGMGPGDLKELASKHGARAVAQALQQHHEEGTLEHAKGRFYKKGNAGVGEVGARAGDEGPDKGKGEEIGDVGDRGSAGARPGNRRRD